MKLALYATEYSPKLVLEKASCDEYEKKRIRLSEYVEVKFPPLPTAEITAAKVAAIDKVLDDLMYKIEQVRAQKQELLALSYETE